MNSGFLVWIRRSASFLYGLWGGEVSHFQDPSRLAGWYELALLMKGTGLCLCEATPLQGLIKAGAFGPPARMAYASESPDYLRKMRFNAPTFGPRASLNRNRDRLIHPRKVGQVRISSRKDEANSLS